MRPFVQGGVVTSATTVKKRVVERYIEGFRTGDHEMILACLTDDVAWEMPPYFKLSGRTAFDDAIENDASPGLPDIQLSRLIEEGDIVVAEGAVQAALKMVAVSTRCSAMCSISGTTRSAAW
jgi:uncharacterized protein